MEARHVRTDLFDHIAQGHKGPCPLRHLERLAVLVKLHKLRQLDVERHLAFRQGRHCRLHPLHIAAVIGTEDIDQLVETALHLVIMVGDIGREIGPGAIRFLHRTVDIIAVGGGFEQRLFPRLPILGQLALGRFQRAAIDETLGIQIGNRLFDEAGAIKRLLGKEVVHGDTKRGEVLADQIHHGVSGEIAHLFQPDLFPFIDVAVADLGLQRLTHFDQIIAGIAALWPIDGKVMRLKIAQVDRPGEDIDLRAAVIDVIFLRDVIARVVEKPRQRVAEHRAARMPHVQGPCGVGRDVFDHDLLPIPHVRLAIGRVRQGGGDHIVPYGRDQPQVQKARACNLCNGDLAVLRQFRRQRLCDHAGVHLRRFRQHHRGIGGHVTMGRVARWFHGDCVGRQSSGQHPVSDQPFKGGQDADAHIGKEVHRFFQNSRAPAVYHPAFEGQQESVTRPQVAALPDGPLAGASR